MFNNSSKYQIFCFLSISTKINFCGFNHQLMITWAAMRRLLLQLKVSSSVMIFFNFCTHLISVSPSHNVNNVFKGRVLVFSPCIRLPQRYYTKFLPFCCRCRFYLSETNNHYLGFFLLGCTSFSFSCYHIWMPIINKRYELF